MPDVMKTVKDQYSPTGERVVVHDVNKKIEGLVIQWTHETTRRQHLDWGRHLINDLQNLMKAVVIDAHLTGYCSGLTEAESNGWTADDVANFCEAIEQANGRETPTGGE